MSWLILDPPSVRLALAEHEPSQGSSERANVGSCVYFCSPVFGVGCALFAALFGKSSEAGGDCRLDLHFVGDAKHSPELLIADSTNVFWYSQSTLPSSVIQPFFTVTVILSFGMPTLFSSALTAALAISGSVRCQNNLIPISLLATALTPRTRLI